MASEGGGDLKARIRQDLSSGKSREEVVGDLVRRGLSRTSAERFVDRAWAERRAAPERPAAPADAEAAEDPGGRRAMISGAFWLSLGACVTGVTYLLAKPGEKYVLAYGAVVAGALAFARGLGRWWRGARGPFPWRAVAVALGLPLMGTCALVGGSIGVRAWQRASRAAEQEERDRAERARLEDEAAAAQREAADQARNEAQTKRVRRALETVRTSTSPDALCSAMALLSRNGATEAVPDLEVLLHNRQYTSVQNCAAGALVRLGEIETALGFYTEAARGADGDLRRAALIGFGEIGPPAAAAALPFLSAALHSPHWDTRYLAVRSLAQLGPGGRPLLEEARNDAQKEVRELATRALAGGG
jgi:hypothetical protein